MAKRNSDGEVLTNKLNLGLAKHKTLLATWMGSEPGQGTAATSEAAEEPVDDEEDLTQNYAHDRLGVGSMLPKDMAGGTSTRRAPSSNDKLLVQLLGAKKAKAHIAAQQEAARPTANAKTPRHGKPAVVKDDDSDEEGRAATFRSKRSQKCIGEKEVREVGSDDEDEEVRAQRLAACVTVDEPGETAKMEDPDAPTKKEPKSEEPESKDAAQDNTASKPAPRKTKAKPKSFLDEILAERSKKKSKKSQA